MLVELICKYIYLFVPTGKVDELSVIKAKSIDEAGRNMSKQVNNLPWNAEAQAFDSPCINYKNPKLLVFTRFPVLVNEVFQGIICSVKQF